MTTKEATNQERSRLRASIPQSRTILLILRSIAQRCVSKDAVWAAPPNAAMVRDARAKRPALLTMRTESEYSRLLTGRADAWPDTPRAGVRRRPPYRPAWSTAKRGR